MTEQPAYFPSLSRRHVLSGPDGSHVYSSCSENVSYFLKFPQACLRVTTRSNVSDAISPNSGSATSRMFIFLYFFMINECFYRCLPISDFECNVVTLCDITRTEYKRPFTSFYHAAGEPCQDRKPFGQISSLLHIVL